LNRVGLSQDLDAGDLRPHGSAWWGLRLGRIWRDARGGRPGRYRAGGADCSVGQTYRPRHV